ncbi:MAG: nuclear transport factor 2 family protein [Deltaproteobacteria bacterium]|nr:nuclear transport factor 2 family protein [Deltaproteobacteria bacterium]MBW2725501.1 nuclear transport factor 2 family protein [Deltaproteobacteria bacterium]
MTRADDHELDPKDHLEILALVSEYARCFDSGDLEAFAELFTPDGSLTTPIGTGSTRAGIREWAETRWSSLRKEGVSPRHFQTNTQLTKTAPGTVRGTTQLLLVWLTSPDGAAQLKGVARYDDEFRHTSEGWRFHRRSIGSDAHPEEPAKNR